MARAIMESFEAVLTREQYLGSDGEHAHQRAHGLTAPAAPEGHHLCGL